MPKIQQNKSFFLCKQIKTSFFFFDLIFVLFDKCTVLKNIRYSLDKYRIIVYNSTAHKIKIN